MPEKKNNILQFKDDKKKMNAIYIVAGVIFIIFFLYQYCLSC